MTLQEFISKVQAYYGSAYREGQQEAIVEYLGSKSPEYMTALYRVCLLRFSSKWKMVPDIAIFEELSEEAVQKVKDYRRSIAAKQPLQIEETDMSEEDFAAKMASVRDLFQTIEKKKRFESQEAS